MSRPVIKRIAVVLAALFVLGALAATFLPTSPQGAKCGNWLNPEWTTAGTQKLIDEFSDLASGDNMGSEKLAKLKAEAGGSAITIAQEKRLCDDSLGHRRTTAIVLVGLALVVPIGLFFIAGASAIRSDVNGAEVSPTRRLQTVDGPPPTEGWRIALLVGAPMVVVVGITILVLSLL